MKTKHLSKKAAVLAVCLAAGTLTGLSASGAVTDQEIVITTNAQTDALEGSYEIITLSPKVAIPGNDTVASAITSQLNLSLGEVQEQAAADTRTSGEFLKDSDASAYMCIDLLRSGVSGQGFGMIFDGAYYSGGAHGYHGCYPYNFDLTTGAMLTYEDVMNTSNQDLDVTLLALLKESWRALDETGYFSEEQIAGKAETSLESMKNGNWMFAGDGLAVNFVPGAIESYAAGWFEVVIPYEKLSGVLKDAYLGNASPGFTEAGIMAGTLGSIVFTDYAHVYGNSGSYVITLDGTVYHLSILESDMPYSGYVDGNTLYYASKADQGDAFLLRGGTRPYLYARWDTLEADGSETPHLAYISTAGGTVDMQEIAHEGDPLPNAQPETQPETQQSQSAQGQNGQAQSPAQTAQPETQPAPQKSEYIFPEVAARKLSYSEITPLTLQEICYAKNEIYARHGRKFVSVELQQYFGSKSWYQPTIEPTAFNPNVFNAFEQANVQLLNNREYELAASGYALDQPGYDINAVRTGF